MKIKVSEKHIGLRIALTAMAFVIAVVAFTFGVTSIGKKEPGYHSIEAKTDAEALTYNNAVLYRYWFDGKSNEIKGKLATSSARSRWASTSSTLTCPQPVRR